MNTRLISNSVPLPTLQRIAQFVRTEAQRRRRIHGFGYGDDKTAESLIAQADAFEAGLNGTIPPRWESYISEALHKDDPEFDLYVRLKSKFENP